MTAAPRACQQEFAVSLIGLVVVLDDGVEEELEERVAFFVLPLSGVGAFLLCFSVIAFLISA